MNRLTCTARDRGKHMSSGPLAFFLLQYGFDDCPGPCEHAPASYVPGREACTSSEWRVYFGFMLRHPYNCHTPPPVHVFNSKHISLRVLVAHFFSTLTYMKSLDHATTPRRVLRPYEVRAANT